MNITPAGILEISALTDRAQKLASGNASDRAISAAILARVKTIRETGISSDEMRAKYTDALLDQLSPGKGTEERRVKAFHQFVFGGEDSLTKEQRNDLTAGQQTISWTLGNVGGYFVPIETESQILAAMKNIDPLLDSRVCDFVVGDSPTQRPITLSQYDLSTITSYLIGETNYTSPASFPNALAATLRGNLIYKVGPIAASIEAQEDIPQGVERLAEAFGVGLARGISQSTITGNGTSDVQGLLTAISTRTYATGTGKITLTDLTDIFFSLDRYWRNQPKTAWLCSDSVYQRIRQATDNSGRPLLHIGGNDEEVLFGKPIYVSPSLPVVGGSLALNSVLLFGDLQQYHVRMSKPLMTRNIQSATKGIEFGQALYSCRARVDAVYIDASSGVSPSIIAATVTA